MCIYIYISDIYMYIDIHMYVDVTNYMCACVHIYIYIEKLIYVVYTRVRSYARRMVIIACPWEVRAPTANITRNKKRFANLQIGYSWCVKGCVHIYIYIYILYHM